MNSKTAYVFMKYNKFSTESHKVFIFHVLNYLLLFIKMNNFSNFH